MKQKLVVVSLVLMSLLAMAFSAQLAGAQSTAQPNVITLAPGDTATVAVRLWCLDFGKPFPTTIQGPSAVAPAGVVSVLSAAAAKNVLDSDPYQVQLAVWKQADGTYHDEAGTGHALAQQLVEAAGGATPAAGGAAAASTAAVAAGTPAGGQILGAASLPSGVSLTIQNVQTVTDTKAPNVPPYAAKASLVVKNNSSQSFSFVVDGTVFKPAAPANAQTLVAMQDPSQSLQVTPAATATAAAVAVTPVATLAPTQAAAAVTPMATETAAVAATSAPAATEVVSAVTATETAVATPATLPTTGGDSSAWFLVILGLGALSLFAGLGLSASRARAR